MTNNRNLIRGGKSGTEDVQVLGEKDMYGHGSGSMSRAQ